MILRVSELQTGWMFVAPIATGRYRDFEVPENRRYLSKPEIVVDFVLPIPPCSARPLLVLTHEITMYYTSNYGFNLLLTWYQNPWEVGAVASEAASIVDTRPKGSFGNRNTPLENVGSSKL